MKENYSGERLLQRRLGTGKKRNPARLAWKALFPENNRFGLVRKTDKKYVAERRWKTQR